MRTRATVATAVLLVSFLVGCSGTGAPGGWLPVAEATQWEAHGAWIRVEQRSAVSDLVLVEGELIAVHEDSLFVLAAERLEPELVSVPRSPNLKAKLGTYDPARGGIAAWTLLGSLSTISHGVNLIFTLPIWIITGSVVANTAKSTAVEYYRGEFEGDSLESLRVYARFPQGLTESIDRASLEPRAPEKVVKDRLLNRRRRR